MDKCAPLPLTIASKKAYTAARTRSDTRTFGERLERYGRSAVEFGDPNLLALQGEGDNRGRGWEPARGIGVSGLAAEEDEAIAKIGLKHN